MKVEPAWPIGIFGWMRPAMLGTKAREELQTGYTPSGRVVPMDHVTCSDGVTDRHGLYRRLEAEVSLPYP